MKNSTVILFCRCSAGVISEKRADELADGLKHLDADVLELSDLCAFSVHGQQYLQEIASTYPRKLIVACYSRAVKNMLRQGGVDFGEFDVVNFREFRNEQVLEELKSTYLVKTGTANYQQQKTSLKVPAWFPVIDTSRCTLCGQCARFCLFGVYKYDKKSLTVVNPLACKNNCPACGRTCPASAIMFPRLSENSVLSGAEPGEQTVGTSGKQGSLLVLLNERNQARKNIFRQGVVQQAEEERRKALEELKNSVRKTD